MFYIDGELVTVGTTKGKSYLNSHPAIISTIQSHFLYGIGIVMRNCHSYSYTYIYSSFADDFESKQPPQAGNSGCQDQPPSCSRGNEDPCSNSIPKDSDTELTSKCSPNHVTVPSHQQSVLLKESTGIVVARGDLMEGRHLHGESVREECM